MRPGTTVVGLRVLVVLDALEERVGAVADADDGDAHLVLRARVPFCEPFVAAMGVLSAAAAQGLAALFDAKGMPSSSASARRMTSFVLDAVRRPRPGSRRFSSSGMRRRMTGLEPGSVLLRPVGGYATPKRVGEHPTATSFRLTPRRAVSRTSALLSEAGILTRTPFRCAVLAGKVLALYHWSASSRIAIADSAAVRLGWLGELAQLAAHEQHPLHDGDPRHRREQVDRPLEPAPRGEPRPTEMITTRSGREPKPTSPRRPSASAFARV